MSTTLAAQQVIDAVVARLVAANTAAGARWWSDRFHPVAQFPAGKVLHAGEDLTTEGDDLTWPPHLVHQLRLEVQWFARASTDLDGALSAGVLSVLAALQSAQRPLAPLNVVLQAVSVRHQAQTDGEAATGMAIVTVEATFGTVASAPHVIT